jgi:hypothetical protein
MSEDLLRNLNVPGCVENSLSFLRFHFKVISDSGKPPHFERHFLIEERKNVIFKR